MARAQAGIAEPEKQTAKNHNLDDWTVTGIIGVIGKTRKRKISHDSLSSVLLEFQSMIDNNFVNIKRNAVEAISYDPAEARISASRVHYHWSTAGHVVGGVVFRTGKSLETWTFPPTPHEPWSFKNFWKAKPEHFFSWSKNDLYFVSAETDKYHVVSQDFFGEHPESNPLSPTLRPDDIAASLGYHPIVDQENLRLLGYTTIRNITFAETALAAQLQSAADRFLADHPYLAITEVQAASDGEHALVTGRLVDTGTIVALLKPSGEYAVLDSISYTFGTNPNYTIRTLTLPRAENDLPAVHIDVENDKGVAFWFIGGPARSVADRVGYEQSFSLEFVNRGYDVLAIDISGNYNVLAVGAKSLQKDHERALKADADAILDFIYSSDFVNNRKLFLRGSSYGGLITLYLQNQLGSRLSGVLYEVPWVHWLDEPSSDEAEELDQELVEYSNDLKTKQWGHSDHDINGSWRLWMDEVRRQAPSMFDHPTVVILGEKDAQIDVIKTRDFFCDRGAFIYLNSQNGHTDNDLETALFSRPILFNPDIAPELKRIAHPNECFLLYGTPSILEISAAASGDRRFISSDSPKKQETWNFGGSSGSQIKADAPKPKPE